MKTTRHPELVSGLCLDFAQQQQENWILKIILQKLCLRIYFLTSFCIFENIHCYSCNISLKVLFYENKNIYSCTKLKYLRSF